VPASPSINTVFAIKPSITRQSRAINHMSDAVRVP